MDPPKYDKEYNKNYYNKNREKIIEINLKKYNENREERLQYFKDYYRKKIRNKNNQPIKIVHGSIKVSFD